MIHQQVAHLAGGDRIKVVAVLKAQLLSGEPQIQLMHDGRGLKRAPWAFAARIIARHAAKLLVNQRKQLIGGLFIAVAPAPDQFGKLVRRGHCAIL